MMLVNQDSTNADLLGQVADWRDDRAWFAFRETYDPLLRQWVRRYGLDEETCDEVCQCIWIELAQRMKTFQYDPTRTFRGWLRRLCGSRVIDYLRKHRAVQVSLAQDFHLIEERLVQEECDEPDGEIDLGMQTLFDRAKKLQDAVKAKVNQNTWDAFWLVVICNWTVEHTAEELKMKRLAVYAACSRVSKRLAEAGKQEATRGLSKLN